MKEKPRKIWLVAFISWIAFHLFALLMVNTGIDFFHTEEWPPKTEKFWPFVVFIGYGYSPDFQLYRFNGIFHHYDITEFAFYVGLAVFVFLIVKILKN